MAGLLRWTRRLASSPRSKLHCHVHVYFRPSRRRMPDCYVRFWPKADIQISFADVRFRGKSGHGLLWCKCPLMTQSRHASRGYKCLLVRDKRFRESHHHCFDQAGDGGSATLNQPRKHRHTLRFACGGVCRSCARGGQVTRANPNSGDEMATPTLMLPQPFRKTACFPE
jgi:hypothetical protein